MDQLQGSIIIIFKRICIPVIRVYKVIAMIRRHIERKYKAVATIRMPVEGYISILLWSVNMFKGYIKLFYDQ